MNLLRFITFLVLKIQTSTLAHSIRHLKSFLLAYNMFGISQYIIEKCYFINLCNSVFWGYRLLTPLDMRVPKKFSESKLKLHMYVAHKKIFSQIGCSVLELRIFMLGEVAWVQ